MHSAPLLLLQAFAPLNHVFARNTVFNVSLPNITIYATGGTITGSAGSTTQTTGYVSGAIGIQALIDAISSILNISNVRGVQVADVDFDSVTPEILLNLTRQISEAVASPYCQGVVVTHWTDTLEETAFFLSFTIRTEKPVILAVTIAVSPSARDQGPMVFLNDRIASACYVTKTNANSLDTFKAVKQGYFEIIQPRFSYPPALPLGSQYFDVTNTKAMPEVTILYGNQGLNPNLIPAAVALGAKGLVLAGMVASGWSDVGNNAVDKVARENGTLMVYSQRTQGGTVPPYASGTKIMGGLLNPQKSQILLQLAIKAGYDYMTTKAIFEFQ